VTKALAIVNRAAEIIGYKDPDEALSSAEQTSFLAALNSMIDAWRLDSLYVYAVSEVVQSVSGNPITVGPAGTGNLLIAERPVRIPRGGFFRNGSIDYPFDMITREQYTAWSVKTIATPWPKFGYYEATEPNGALYLYPALSGSGELHLPIEQRLAQFADINTTDYTLANGVQNALEFSLAEQLAPGRRPLDPNVARMAANARRRIERFVPGVLSTGFEHNTGNILSGWNQ
jgi:hypothetical protein